MLKSTTAHLSVLDALSNINSPFIWPHEQWEVTNITSSNLFHFALLLLCFSWLTKYKLLSYSIYLMGIRVQNLQLITLFYNISWVRHDSQMTIKIIQLTKGWMNQRDFCHCQSSFVLSLSIPFLSFIADTQFHRNKWFSRKRRCMFENCKWNP